MYTTTYLENVNNNFRLFCSPSVLLPFINLVSYSFREEANTVKLFWDTKLKICVQLYNHNYLGNCFGKRLSPNRNLAYYSATGWIDFIFNIWPFTTMNFSPLGKNCQSRFKLFPYTKLTLQKYSDFNFFAKVGKFCQILSHWYLSINSTLYSSIAELHLFDVTLMAICRHSSVKSSAPTTLRPLVRILSTPPRK